MNKRRDLIIWISIKKDSGQKESKCKGPEAGEWLLMNEAACVAAVEMRPDKQAFVDMKGR